MICVWNGEQESQKVISCNNKHRLSFYRYVFIYGIPESLEILWVLKPKIIYHLIRPFVSYPLLPVSSHSLPYPLLSSLLVLFFSFFFFIAFFFFFSFSFFFFLLFFFSNQYVIQTWIRFNWEKKAKRNAQIFPTLSFVCFIFP